MIEFQKVIKPNNSQIESYKAPPSIYWKKKFGICVISVSQDLAEFEENIG